MRKIGLKGFPYMLVGYMRVSTADERQSVDLQRDALMAARVDDRHLYQDHASGSRDDRPGLKPASPTSKRATPSWCGSLTGSAAASRTSSRSWATTEAWRRLPLSHRGDGHRDTAWRAAVLTVRGAGAIRAPAHPERVIAGLAAAKRRGRRGGRPPAIGGEQLEQITAALDGGAARPRSVGRSRSPARR